MIPVNFAGKILGDGAVGLGMNDATENHAPLIAFARAVEARANITCMATQGAIDRIASEYRAGRAGLLAALTGSFAEETMAMRREDFVSALLCVWVKDGDVRLATGYGRDFWFGLLKRTEAAS